ncbi:Annexin A5 [Thelohanellus kitauei]|uniref:Annexin n=1 Tax=Thelohanellus kitauei TaxID=669202 RepID=A0A0C2MB87_THEKT|nr:Annexin A5 [Thelohanellus kitauei]
MASEHKKDKVKKNHFAPTLGQIHPCVPTLKPFQHAVPSADAQALLTAFSGIGITILTRLRSAHGDEYPYSSFFSPDRTDKKRISIHNWQTASELYEPAEYLAVCRLYTGPDADAYILRRATKGAGTDDNILIHILSTRSSAQMACIKESYVKMFKKPLLDHVRSDTSGSYKDVLTYLIEKPRSLAPGDHVLAAQQATMMYSRSIVNITASEKFIPIFGDSSYEQIKMIGTAFQQVTS